MDIIDDGIDICANAEQSSNVCESILIIEFGIFICVIEIQPLKA